MAILNDEITMQQDKNMNKIPTRHKHGGLHCLQTEDNGRTVLLGYSEKCAFETIEGVAA